MSFKKYGDSVDSHNLEESESCSILIGSIIPISEYSHHFIAVERKIDFEGKPFEVNFNYKDVYALEDAGFPVIGFWHTHPFQEDSVCYSPIDDKTMRSWCSVFGRDLLCVIENVKKKPTVFVFSKQGDVKTGTIWKCHCSEEDTNSIFIGRF